MIKTYINMQLLQYSFMANIDILRFLIGFVILSYGSWSDLKTRRVPNLVWIYGGILGSVLLVYELSTIWEYYGLYIWALLFATLTLFFNSFVDEYILDKNQAILWKSSQYLAILCSIYFFFSFDSNDISKNNYQLLDFISIPILMILMYVWFYFGPTIGGADVKAIMAISLITPFSITFTDDSLTAFDERGFPYPFVIFMNSLLIYLFIPICLAILNIIKGNIERPFFQIFLGTKMELNKAKESFVWPMQQVVGKRVVMVAFVKHKSDSNKDWNRLEEKGIDYPWVTFKIPYIIPLALSFVITAFFGDIFSSNIVQPLNSLFS
tara:strand:+ start:3346 stop:4314 length:969 start_codon:yes stop_codon:yes gene_type:complete